MASVQSFLEEKHRQALGHVFRARALRAGA